MHVLDLGPNALASVEGYKEFSEGKYAGGGVVHGRREEGK